MKSTGYFFLTAALSIVTLSGCVSTPTSTLLKDPGRLVGRPRTEKNVVKVLCLWEPSQGTGVDGKPSRGFAGQILFFGPKDKAAVRAAGEVRITEYEPYDPEDEELPEPLHTFNFSAEAWDVHCTEGSLGYSYSVFIPYTKKHRDVAHCGLKVEFIGEGGRTVSSDITAVILPAKGASSTTALKRNVVKNVRPASKSEVREDSNSTSHSPKNSLNSETIALPR
ncbi:MAG: hypothetical protein JNL58_18530 [Planctomyces sp.]|nr:hypothetical protein [Planctomyces sp.]